MAFRKDRVKPTHYPRLPFHLIRSAQLVSSLVVASIMFYFLKELAHDNYKLPWTFILLFAVSLLTILALTTTIVLHCFYGLNPVLNTSLNGALTLLWSVAFSLLSWWSSSTLSHVCNVDNWEDELGISVCRLYKALFSFALLGLVATLLALLLDVRVQRNATQRGTFQQLQMMGGGDGKREVGEQEHDEHDEHEVHPNSTAARRNHGQQQRGGEGYALPEEQFAYEDTAYQGAAGQVGRRSLQQRP
ncbi:uncharacterized protein K460DRAFT_273142 [Cucurbitaria berberidis CBS 394.84]|uniref:MARVEL domain-containing protein n=1 Tax=Cucurbitaria berberidis CBS 394.84 TaxID=1168544 RepID=A0A9P4GPL9_9PLEO|nr:uncharacterized protein K460DRAFT_273142 [Cucurbitaria berberidis CBS 394.84]KAF1850303.1 hypothetical protein K460DRAFT_273142 [Cucurbitaria berberidis CBS 394.84]